MDAQCLKCFSYLFHDGTCPICDTNKARNRGYFRHQRQRIIKKRQNIVKYAWGEMNRFGFVTEDGHFGSPRFYMVVSNESYWERSVYKLEPGRLAKHNLSCNCWLCKYSKKSGEEKHKYLYLNNE